VVSIGQMNKVGILKANTPVKDGGGGSKDNYTTTVSVRGKLERRFGSKENAADQMQFSTTFNWWVWQQDALVFNKKSIWLIDNQKYMINDWEQDGLTIRFTVTRLDA
jgi:hypothetical protein